MPLTVAGLRQVLRPFTFASLPTLSASDRAMVLCPDWPGIGETILEWNGLDWSPWAITQESYAAIGSADRYYACGAVNATALTTLLLVTNTLYAVPFVPQRTGVIDRLNLVVTTAAAGGNLLQGIYSNTIVGGVPYPGLLLVPGTAQATTATGTKPSTVSQQLHAGRLYWAVLSSSGAPSIRAMQVASMSSFLGVASNLGSAPFVFLSTSRAYDGTLPAAFPAGATSQVTISPALYYRWAS